MRNCTRFFEKHEKLYRLATKKLSDEWTVGGGVTHGWDNFDNSGNPHAGALATASYTINEQEALAWVGVYGAEPAAFANDGFSTRYFQTLVYSNKISDDVAYYLQSDFGVQGNASQVDGGVARWYGVNQYLYWNQTCRMQWGLNLEWFRDEGGSRVGAVLPSGGSPNARGWSQPAGYDGSFYVVTFGPKYFFTPNLYTRAALRADWYDGKRNVNNGSMPYDDGTKSHQQIVVFDVVWTF